MMAARGLEEKLVGEGLLTAEQLAKARTEATRLGITVRQALTRLKLLEPDVMARWLSHELKLPRVELKSYLIDTQLLDVVPEPLARKHHMIPLFKVGKALTVAIADPLNLAAFDELRLRSGLTIEPAVATELEIAQALEQFYGAQGRLDEVVALSQDHPPGEQEKSSTPSVTDVSQAADSVSEPPVVRLVNLLLTDAVHQRASDVHLESEKEALRVRFRVDGILKEFTTVPKHMEAAVISRVKLLATLNIAERRKPQDGRFRMTVDNHDIDVRLSVMPSIDGETVVLRLLDAQGMSLGLDQLGMAPGLLARYHTLLQRAWGMVLVTGPTGSGKTTTLYASLATLNAVERNIVTIEDPVEYRLRGVRQIPVNPLVDLTFATGLRSILRQDPDVIMVGEIRDRATAEIAIQAALTGHLVFSTLHTNDAPTAITRLIDMGVEPFLVASSLIGVVAQRLVRTICPECKIADPTQEAAAARLKVTPHGRWKRGKGCRQCGQAGYRGRIGIYELMVMDDELNRMTIAKASTTELRGHALAAGMCPLRDDGLAKVSLGITTVDEALRVTQEA